MKAYQKYLLWTLAAAAFCGAAYWASQERKTEENALCLADESARTAWLMLRGWEVGDPETAFMRVPDSYQTAQGQRWLTLQAAQGLHPEEHAGCEALRYRYPVRNGGGDNWYAELILCGNTLIGAQVYDAATGVMQSVL